MGARSKSLDDGGILELVARIYDAALDPARWQDFLETVGQLYPDTGRVVWFEDSHREDVGVISASGFAPEHLEAYVEHYAAVNPWTEAGLRQPPGFIHTDDMLVPERVLLRSEFYDGWLRPQGLRYGFGTSVFNDGERMMFFSVALPPGQAPGTKEVELCRRLLPHLRRAGLIHHRFGELELRAASLEALVDRLGVGVFLLGEDGGVVLMNAMAEALVREGDGLVLRGGSLGTAAAAEGARLREAIAGALATAAGRGSDGGGQILVTRPSGRRPLAVVVVPMFPRDTGALTPLATSGPAAAVLVADPWAERVSGLATVGQVHGLTEAETRLLGALVSAGTLKEAASSLGIAHETARGQLKTVFDKTGTHSQAELVRVVLSSATVTVAVEPGN